MTVPPRGPRRIRPALDLLPALAFAATFGVFAVDKTREARTVLSSPRGMLAVAAVVAGYLVTALVLRRTARAVAPVLLGGVVLALAAWIVRPYYVDSTADRTLVTGPPSAVAGVPGAGGDAGATDPMPVGPVVVATGALAGIGHEGRGTVSLLRTVDQSLVVRFSDFEVEGVPDPRVHLVRGERVQRPGGVGLGRLPGNRGRVLDLAVPAGSGAGPGWTVLIWCRAFSVPVAHATLLHPGT